MYEKSKKNDFFSKTFSKCFMNKFLDFRPSPLFIFILTSAPSPRERSNKQMLIKRIRVVSQKLSDYFLMTPIQKNIKFSKTTFSTFESFLDYEDNLRNLENIKKRKTAFSSFVIFLSYEDNLKSCEEHSMKKSKN